jgi:ribonucleoside-triphosphate reductase
MGYYWELGSLKQRVKPARLPLARIYNSPFWFIKENTMRTIEEIDRDLTEARESLAHVEGGPAEVYSRIVGYYRSVRNWNKGKREEYGERKLYEVSDDGIAEKTARETTAQASTPFIRLVPQEEAVCTPQRAASGESRVLLFVRPQCPACPSAKDAANRLGIPVDMVNADTDAGLAEAGKRNVFSTPTAILLSNDGKEIGRAMDGDGIAAFEDLIAV